MPDFVPAILYLFTKSHFLLQYIAIWSAVCVHRQHPDDYGTDGMAVIFARTSAVPACQSWLSGMSIRGSSSGGGSRTPPCPTFYLSLPIFETNPDPGTKSTWCRPCAQGTRNQSQAIWWLTGE